MPRPLGASGCQHAGGSGDHFGSQLLDALLELRVLAPPMHCRDADVRCSSGALNGGARECEAFALQWSDIDWGGHAVQIVRSLEEISGALRLKDLKTKKSRRRIALSAFTMEALAAHRQAMVAEGNYRPDGPVFSDTNGGWLRKSNVLRRSFRPILQKAGLPKLRPYDLRHSSATLLLLAGEDSKVVAERLGHSTTVLTQNTYQHVLPGMQERAAKKLDTIFRTEVLTASNKTA